MPHLIRPLRPHPRGARPCASSTAGAAWQVHDVSRDVVSFPLSRRVCVETSVDQSWQVVNAHDGAQITALHAHPGRSMKTFLDRPLHLPIAAAARAERIVLAANISLQQWVISFKDSGTFRDDGTFSRRCTPGLGLCRSGSRRRTNL